jgi:hypothetical protein
MARAVLSGRFSFADANYQLSVGGTKLKDPKSIIPNKPDGPPVVTVATKAQVLQKLTMIDLDSNLQIMSRDCPLDLTAAGLMKLLGNHCLFFYQQRQILEQDEELVISCPRGLGPIQVRVLAGGAPASPRPSLKPTPTPGPNTHPGKAQPKDRRGGHHAPELPGTAIQLGAKTLMLTAKCLPDWAGPGKGDLPYEPSAGGKVDPRLLASMRPVSPLIPAGQPSAFDIPWDQTIISLKMARCNLILPRGDMNPVNFSIDDTVAVAEMYAAREYGLTSFHILDSDNNVLDPNRRLIDIPEPRDLFLAEHLVLKIRSPRTGTPEDHEVAADGKVSDLDGLLTAQYRGCRFANELGLFLEPSWRLRDIGQAVIAVPKQSQGSVRVQVFDLEPQEIQVDLDAPTLDLVAQVCSDQSFDPSEAVIVDDTGVVTSDSILRSVAGIVKCIHQPQLPSADQVPGLVSTHSTDKLQSGVSVALLAALASALPDLSDIDQQFPPGKRRQKYPLVYDGKSFEMEIPDSAMVADTKEFVARKFKSRTENVKLFHLGKELRNIHSSSRSSELSCQTPSSSISGRWSRSTWSPAPSP